MKEKLEYYIKKNNLSNIIIGTVLAISFIILLYININTHIFHDEFVYSIIYGTEQKTQSIADIFTSVQNVYLNHNGRAIAILTASILLKCGGFVRAIINSAFFTLLIFELIKFPSKNDESGNLKILIALLVFPLLWYALPVMGETVIWITGAVNYLWAAVVLLYEIYLVENIFEKEIEYKRAKLLGFGLLCLITGSLHEMTGIVSIVFCGLALLYLLIKNKKINKTLLTGELLNIVGFASVILSPGSNIRKSITIQTMDNVPGFIEKLKNCLIMLENTIKTNWPLFVLIGITILFILYTVIKNRKKCLNNKNIQEILFLLIAAVISYIAMVASPTFLLRVTFVPAVIFIYVGLKCLYVIRWNKKFEYFKYGVLIIAIIVLSSQVFSSMIQSFKLLNEQKIAWTERDVDIANQKKLGKKDIYVDPFVLTPKDLHLYFDDITNSITFNYNKSMANYYEVNSIRLKHKYYLDIELTNVNEDNANSITVSADGYNETVNFHIVDKYLYDKQPPYKRYKNAYKDGDIILYYAMDSMENLQITFAKEQKISITKLKVYTPDNTLIEAKGKEILNYFQFKDIQIDESTENVVVLNVNNESSISLK